MEAEHWITCHDMQAGVLHLRNDGTIGLGGTPFPQSATLENMEFDGARVDKKGGTGEVLTVTDDRGTLHARYQPERRTWQIRHSDDDLHAALEQKAQGFMFSGPSGPHAAQAHGALPRAPAPIPQTPYPVPGPLVAQRSNTAGIIATVAMIGMVAVISLIAFRKPISDSLKGWAADREREALLEKQRAEYRKLEEAVRPEHTMIKDKLEALQGQADSFFPKVEKLARRSLDRMTADPPDVPKTVRDAFRFVEEFRTPWNDLLNAYIATNEFSRTARETLDDLTRRIEQKSLRPDDRTTLVELSKALEKAEKRLGEQPQNLATVRQVLARRENEAYLTHDERSPP